MMGRTLPVLTLLMLLAAGPASRPANQPAWTLRDGAAPALQGLIGRQPEVRPAAIERLQAAVEAAKKQLSGAHGDELKAIRERIAELNHQLADIRGHKVIARDPAMEQPRQIEVGWAGAGLGARLRCQVLRVVDEQNAIVDIIYDGQVGDIRQPVTVQKSVTFWVAGVPTEGWADDKRVALPAMLVAAGVNQARSASYIELRPFSPADFVHHDDVPRQPDQKRLSRPRGHGEIGRPSNFAEGYAR